MDWHLRQPAGHLLLWPSLALRLRLTADKPKPAPALNRLSEFLLPSARYLAGSCSQPFLPPLLLSQSANHRAFLSSHI